MHVNFLTKGEKVESNYGDLDMHVEMDLRWKVVGDSLLQTLVELRQVSSVEEDDSGALEISALN